jgi:hypothetical protein
VCRVFFIFKESFPGFARMRVSHEDWISLKGEGHRQQSASPLLRFFAFVSDSIITSERFQMKIVSIGNLFRYAFRERRAYKPLCRFIKRAITERLYALKMFTFPLMASWLC